MTNYRSALVTPAPQDLQELLTPIFAATTLYTTLHATLHPIILPTILPTSYHRRYIALTHKERAVYRSKIVTLVHSSIIVPLAYIALKDAGVSAAHGIQISQMIWKTNELGLLVFKIGAGYTLWSIGYGLMRPLRWGRTRILHNLVSGSGYMISLVRFAISFSFL